MKCLLAFTLVFSSFNLLAKVPSYLKMGDDIAPTLNLMDRQNEYQCGNLFTQNKDSYKSSSKKPAKYW